MTLGTSVILNSANAASYLALDSKNPYTDDRQRMGPCCGGFGPIAYVTQRLSTDSLPYRSQKFGMQTAFLGAGPAPDTIVVQAQTRTLLATGQGAAGSTVGLPIPTLNQNWGDIQTRGSFFNRYCFLLIGLSFGICGAVQRIATGAHTGALYSGQGTVDVANSVESRMFNQTAGLTSIGVTTADEECISRLGVMAMYQDSTGAGNLTHVSRNGSGGAMIRDFLIFNQAILVGGLDNDQLLMTLELLQDLYIANPGGGVPFQLTATIDGAAVTLDPPTLIFWAKFWGKAACCPVIADCPIV